MVMASATNDLVQKKMVYLYLVNYAESNSELAILAINTLQKDCRDDDPMIRGLALRSLCSLNLSNTVEYLQPAVQRALEDINGYVRKTAAIGAVKLFHMSRDSVLETNILPALQKLVTDSDVYVVTNAIYAIEEVMVDEGGLEPAREMVLSLLNRIMQFSEWGQCAVLRLLAKYQVADEGEMFDIMNVLDGLLKQSSSAVVLGVTKIFLDLTCSRSELLAEVLQRLKGPLLTLMAAATPELAYTVLVHVRAIIQRGGVTLDVFGPEFKQFFCRYNEPSYIKSVKIDILQSIADMGSAEAIVAELSEYVTDVDAGISRQAIRAIGKIGIRIPYTAEMIVNALTDLLELDIEYVSTESAVVMKDLVRKYPDQFQRASGAVERCIRIVTEPEGKCAVLWILGEYGNEIEDAPYLLEPMIDGFLEETSGPVRLEMLTAAVKLFFGRPPEVQAMLGRLLEKAIEESSHPDVRDRAILYYRLLQISPAEAERVICCPKQVVQDFQEEIDHDAKERIFEEFNTLGTVYKQPASKFVLGKVPSAFFGAIKMNPPPRLDDGQSAYDAPEPASAPAASPAMNGDAFGLLDDAPQQVASAPTPSPMASADLLGESIDEQPAAAWQAPRASAPAAPMEDLLGMGDLLGGADSPMPAASRAAPSFTLAPAVSMDGASFQARWAALPALPPQQRMLRNPPSMALSTAVIEAAVRRVGIHVIASGNAGGVLKFFFYAKQASGPDSTPAGHEVWFLCEVLVAPGSSVQCSLRAENAQAASNDGFHSALWGALTDFVAS
eukprot:TRINITY_DN6314_c0_g2_i1.p1 TRINITY_DN6314_c0_g2~~TRINITY_DN6314_c0_g2_i1.p1  ORF type:complete len:874 (-),score=199.29 TRINITY_DN6314_c0_g2_i1:189-2534(-)